MFMNLPTVEKDVDQIEILTKKNEKLEKDFEEMKN